MIYPEMYDGTKKNTHTAFLSLKVNVCVTTFKIVLRELGMTNWPYRQIRRVKGMAQLVRNNPELFEVMI